MTEFAFSRLGLPAAQLDNLDKMGYEQMTAIQAASLPLALAGKDLIAQAKTGSGKTAAFTLPLLEKLNPANFGVQGLILCPTRELATQVATEMRRLARYRQNIKVVILCGGQSIGPQIGSLAHGAHIVVGTPGRIRDHVRKKTLSLSGVQTLVLDEADRMLEMGFLDDIEAIVSETPSARQTLLFSATYPDDIVTLSSRFQRSPEQVVVAGQHSQAQISQHFFVCESGQKCASLERLLTHFQPEACVVFCNTKALVREVDEFLNGHGISTVALHGDMEQRERDQVLVRFRHRSARVMVATDVAARGLDIDALPAVFNYELPRDPQVYVHRIGRTGRAGRAGLAVSLFADSERYKLSSIATYQEREPQFKAVEEVTGGKSGMPAPRFVTLCIAGGRKNKVRPGDILGALTGEAGIDGKAVGKIDVMDYAAYVAIEAPLADQALGRLLNGKIKGRKFKVRRL